MSSINTPSKPLTTLNEEQRKAYTRSIVAFSKSLSKDKETQKDFAKKARAHSKSSTVLTKMTAYRLFGQEYHNEIMEGRNPEDIKPNAVKEYSRVKRNIWTRVKGDEAVITSLNTRALEYNVHHELIPTESKKRSSRSAFFEYAAEMRPKLKQDTPTLHVTERAKVLGSMWNSLTDGEREVWKKKARTE